MALTTVYQDMGKGGVFFDILDGDTVVFEGATYTQDEADAVISEFKESYKKVDKASN